MFYILGNEDCLLQQGKVTREGAHTNQPTFATFYDPWNVLLHDGFGPPGGFPAAHLGLSCWSLPCRSRPTVTHPSFHAQWNSLLLLSSSHQVLGAGTAVHRHGFREL